MTTPQPDQQQIRTLLALIGAQAAARAALTVQAVAIVRSALLAFRGWYNTDQISEWAQQLATRIQALQIAQARSTDAYLARATSVILGTRVIRPIGAVDTTALRQAVTAAGAYGRTIDTYRWQQSRWDKFGTALAGATLTNGAPVAADGTTIAPIDLDRPLDAALKRGASIARMDIQLADRAQSQAFIAESAGRAEISGYRRVVHPELSKGGTCGLCIAASDRKYHIHDLRAVHDRCECTVLPIIGDQDPGNSLNDLDLKTLYKNAGGTTHGAALKTTRYQFDEHGELGLVLAPKGARRGVPGRQRPDRPESAERTREKVERILAREIAAQTNAERLAGNDPNKWGAYARALDERIADLRHELAQQL